MSRHTQLVRITGYQFSTAHSNSITIYIRSSYKFEHCLSRWIRQLRLHWCFSENCSTCHRNNHHRWRRRQPPHCPCASGLWKWALLHFRTFCRTNQGSKEKDSSSDIWNRTSYYACKNEIPFSHPVTSWRVLNQHWVHRSAKGHCSFTSYIHWHLNVGHSSWHRSCRPYIRQFQTSRRRYRSWNILRSVSSSWKNSSQRKPSSSYQLSFRLGCLREIGCQSLHTHHRSYSYRCTFHSADWPKTTSQFWRT